MFRRVLPNASFLITHLEGHRIVFNVGRIETRCQKMRIEDRRIRRSTDQVESVGIGPGKLSTTVSTCGKFGALSTAKPNAQSPRDSQADL